MDLNVFNLYRNPYFWLDTLLFLITFVLFLTLLISSFYGLDFSDEGFYLNWIARPELYSASYTHFGYLYNPLYILMGEDVARLRIANMIIIIGLGWALTHAILISICQLRPNRSVFVLSFALSAPVTLWQADYFLLTPSYNSGTYIGIIISLLSAVGILFGRPDYKTSFYFILALAGFIVALSKPTSAIVLGISLIALFALVDAIYWRAFLSAFLSVVGLFLAFAISLDGSLWDFYYRVSNGLEIILLRNAGYNVESMNFKNFFAFVNVLFNPNSIVIALIIFLLLIFERTRDILSHPIALLSTPSLIIFLYFYSPPFAPFIFYSLSFGALAAAIFGNRTTFLGEKRREFFFALTLLLIPPIFAFGTNSALWQGARSAAFFPFLAAMIFITTSFTKLAQLRILRIMCLLALTFTSYSLFISASIPYRQNAPIWRMDDNIKFKNGAQLNLERSFAIYAQKYLELAANDNTDPIPAIIDLSGRSPSIAYVLDTGNIGTPWMNGAYPGSIVSAKHALSFVNCEEIHSAWLITEPGGPRELKINEFSSLGIFLENYELVGSIQVPPNLSGHKKSGIQYFYKPKPTDTQTMCYEKSRELGNNMMHTEPGI